MEEMQVNGENLFWDNPKEILGMGGPWVGDLMLGYKKISTCIVVDNFLHDKDRNRLYFIKYNLISKWARDNFFSIMYYDIDSNELSDLNKKYDMVYLESIEGNRLVIFHAFHNKDTSKKAMLNLT
jgi:hypothetical protein